MTNSPISISIDVHANAGYILMSDQPIVHTNQVTDDVLVDLDAMNVVVGIEVLQIDAEIPFQRLIDEYHVHSNDVETLRLLRPSVGASLAFRQGSDGTASPVRGVLLVG